MASSTSVRFPDALKAEAMAYADALGISLNALCAVALRDYLDSRRAAVPVPEARPSVVPAPAVPVSSPAAIPKPAGGVNAPCPCGSGQKYKRCHGRA